MAVRPILLLGHPGLRVRCKPVDNNRFDAVHALIDDLRDTLYDFRQRRGFGRGIAAPQIGKPERVIFIHLDEPIALINPVVSWQSASTFTLWDDCFSFPDLMVKVKRHRAIEVRYRTREGERKVLRTHGALSELLQHELDHLNGVLAIDRALDSKHIMLREEWERRLHQ